MSSVINGPGKSRRIWRSLRELNNDPEFEESVKHEFATPIGDVAEELPATEQAPNGRRRFLQTMSASAAVAAVASGCRWDEHDLLPLNRRPEGRIPGIAQFFSSAMELGGVAMGTLVKSYSGRPIKVEGNPEHPGSLGACGIYQQAATLELYDPDRSKAPMRSENEKHVAVSAADFEKFAKDTFGPLKAKGGAGVAVLTESTASPTTAAAKQRFLQSFPQAQWFEYEPINDDNVRVGANMAFNQTVRTKLDASKAKVILSLDSDILGEHPDWIPQSRGFAATRVPEAGSMSRLYVFESAFTMTGGMADNRLPIRAELIKALAAAFDAEISKKVPGHGGGQPRPNAAFLNDPTLAAMLSAAVADLVANPGASIVATGDNQPAAVHALVHRMNAVLGNVGKTVSYTTLPDPVRPPMADALAQLVDAMNDGKVDTLVILGGNPVYNSPADIEFKSALEKVKTSIHLALYQDETSLACNWHYPKAHWLESWNDSTAYDGTISIGQPLIAPLYGGKTSAELLALLNGEAAATSLDLVKNTHGLDPRLWRQAVHAGMIAGTAYPTVTTQLSEFAPMQFAPNELGDLRKGASLELQFTRSSSVYDGRFANSGWLQETPDMMTKLTWDNALTIAPSTAKELGLTDRDVVQLAIDGRELPRVPVMLQPGQAPGTLRLDLGYGRTAAGRTGGLVSAGVKPVGVNAYELRTSKIWNFGGGATVQKVGSGYELATMQDMHAMDTVGRETIENRVPALIRTTTFSEYEKQPDFAHHVVHELPLVNMWKSPVSYDGEKWGMSIDLNKCIGCSACITACVAENNIPVAGKERVLMGRELHWIAVQRYYMGDEDNPELAHQPLTCHQCENAPCEQVCPVGATLHSVDGLNDMTYNRCIGTRYCSNNCPYKVRRFNYFNYHEDLKNPKNEVKKMVFNPEVTVRFRGVMEKCTFCVQRIRRGKLDAKNEHRPLADQEIQTACQQTCPTDAIVFGDLNQKGSQVEALHKLKRSYAMLGELNNIPRLQYLAKVNNPNPALAPSDDPAAEKAHH